MVRRDEPVVTGLRGWSHPLFTRTPDSGRMAKQKAYLIVGLPHTGVPLLTAALADHRDALAELGVRAPAKSVEEMFRAAVEVRREHRAWGLRRRDVEGSWADVSRRAAKHKEDVVLGHELLAGATADEIALLVDGLRGVQLHVVVVAGPPDARVALFPDELDLVSVLDRWESAAGQPDRVHVLAGGDPWAALGELVGFDAAALPLPDGVAAQPADAASLRLVAEASGVHVDDGELVDLAEHWAEVVADRGYAVRGDLAALRPSEAAGATDRVGVLSEALVEAVTEIGRLREQLQDAQAGGRRRSVRLPGVLVRGA